MGNLTNINRCSQSTFNSIVEGTHATETYDPNAIYEVELDDPVELGAEGSGLTINTDNQLMCDLAVSNIPSLPLTKISDVTATATEVNVLDGITATTQELNYTDGVTSNIQTQLDSKQATLTAGTGISITNNTISSKVTFSLNGTELTITSTQ